MKERIEKKIEEKLEIILNKEEISKEDFDILNIMLLKLEQKEKDDLYEEKNKELAELFSKTLIK